tara:strand:- start:131 stop:1459 length:1329 start_codon:yes stop_codon:yes gene_type:complete
MIIQDLSKQTIISSIKDYVDDSHYSENKERLMIMDYYEGINLDKYVMEYFDSNALRFAVPFEANITQELIDSRYIAYKSAPQRNADEKYLELLGDLDQDMIQVDRLTGLLGTIGMLRYYNEEKEILDSHIITDFEPIYEMNNSDPVAVVYPLYNHGNMKSEEQQFVFWSKDMHFKMTKGGQFISVNEDDVNPYGVIPVLFSHLYPMIGNEWFRTGKGKMVANANCLYNVFGTQLSLGNMYQTLGQSVLTGVDESTRLKMDVSKMLVLPEGANYSIVSPSGSLSEIRENQKWVYETTASALHLKKKWGSDSNATSGEHQRILEVDLTEAVMSDFERFRKFEKERFELDQRILETYNINVSDEYSVDFSEPHIPLSPQQEREEWMWKWDNGLATTKDWLRHYNPDFTEEEINETMERIEQESQPKKLDPKPTNETLVERLINGS